MRPCYLFRNITASNGETPSLDLLEDIGFFGMQAKDFLAQLGQIQGPVIEVNISSMGGDLFAALTMYNALRASGKKITTNVLGVAASAASLVMLAGDDRIMPKNSHVMVHNPSVGVGRANASELRETADILEKIGASVAATYAERTGLSKEDVAAMFAKDTWLDADECLANGFATALVDEIRVTAKFDMERADLPASVSMAFVPVAQTQEQLDPSAAKELADEAQRVADEAQRIADEEAASQLAKEQADALATHPLAEEINAMVVSAGLEAFAPMWAVSCTAIAEVQAKINVAKEIKSLCGFAKAPEQAIVMIRENKTLAEARTALMALMVAEDEKSSISTIRPNAGNGSAVENPKAESTVSIWNKRNNISKS